MNSNPVEVKSEIQLRSISDLKFDKNKYLSILQSEGCSAALTTLHKDIIQWEVESFEGRKGYQPEMWNALHEIRQFSRELWEICLTQSGAL